MAFGRAVLVLVLLTSLAAADVELGDILPTTGEFRQAFGNEWKHPWDFPESHPLYKSREQMEREFEEGLEMAASPEMAELLCGDDDSSICRDAGTPGAECIEQVKFAGASMYSEPRVEEKCSNGCEDGECL